MQSGGREEGAVHVRANRLKDGRTAMAFCENYRDGRRTRTRTVERIGCVEDFPELDDPIAHFKQVARERTAAAREESTVTVELHMAQKADKRAEGERRCAGAAVACTAYNALGYRWSCEEILDDMATTCMTRLVSNIWVSDHRTDLTDELFALMGSPAPLKQMRLKDVKALFAKSVEIDLRRKSPRKKKSSKKR